MVASFVVLQVETFVLCAFTFFSYSSGFESVVSFRRRHGSSDSNRLRRMMLSSVDENMMATVSDSVCSTERRSALQHAMKALLIPSVVAYGPTGAASASSPVQVTEEELDALYDNPEIPAAPEERSGLVVLRVAEVAQFQEKILRAVAAGELEGVKIAPMQFSFGTMILLRNSNLDGNMKLMIKEEIPRKSRKDAVQCAVNVMNTLQNIAKFADSIQRDFETEEMITMADMYLAVRVNLNQMYEFLPEKEQGKYYGYFAAVTDYEKKIAEGTYNPDIDGKLVFD